MDLHGSNVTDNVIRTHRGASLHLTLLGMHSPNWYHRTISSCMYGSVLLYGDTGQPKPPTSVDHHGTPEICTSTCNIVTHSG
jgi:hypothetical protein